MGGVSGIILLLLGIENASAGTAAELKRAADSEGRWGRN